MESDRGLRDGIQRWRKGVFDHYVRASVNVRNDGVDGNITVTAAVIVQSSEIERQTQVKFVKANQIQTFEFVLWEIDDASKPFEVRYGLAPK